MRTASTDPALWTTRPIHGVAGGPLEVVLTEEGQQRAFSVGAQVRRGAPLAAMMTLSALGGSAHIAEKTGTTMRLTDLGRMHTEAWAVLADRGYTERWYDATGDGVRLTSAGRIAVANGHAEQVRLLARCIIDNHEDKP